ncbi:glycosyltransferase [Microbacterium sp. SLBN-146]|uniref:glycosyltransferase n=1 Tax=Microbacterium sp. SLBN-146 TaxID=2768457 RepID=UPI0011540AC8|nr:glycosyltransferase [Microbacterium sp. SLBN-146]TQJ29574.1 glycosyltransferase involved in cell wall biosynthesis [Microbacterium sp. SLBN-146]
MTSPASPLRSVFVCHSSLAVGVERTLVTLVRAAVERGDAVDVIIPGPGPLVDLLEQFRGRIGLRFRKAQWWMGPDHTGPRGIAKLLHAASQIPVWTRMLRRSRPDRVYVMSTVCPAPIAAARRSGAAVVVFLSESMRTNDTLRSVISKPAIARRVRAWADVTVAVSDFAAAQWGGADVVEVPEIVPPGAPVELATPPASGPLRLVMLGTLSAEKGQADAVRAVSRAREQGADVMLDLYGDADAVALADLLRLAANLGSADIVHHRGATSDALAVLRGADASLVCSLNEAYGRVTAESLLVGTPVAGYRLGGTAEILAAGGGVLVDPTPDALADALVALAARGDVLDDVRAQARERASTREGFGDAAATLRAIEDRIAAQASDAS